MVEFGVTGFCLVQDFTWFYVTRCSEPVVSRSESFRLAFHSSNGHIPILSSFHVLDVSVWIPA